MTSSSINHENTTESHHPKFQEAFPPKSITLDQPSVFLAGSIEMGKAEQWQQSVTKSLSDLPITVLNPRRLDWDPSLKQEIDCKPFKDQVDWELDYLEACDVIALYLQPGTRSPISLMELGLYAESRKIIVCCPKGFWRKGNVDIICSRYDLKLVTTMEELIVETRATMEGVLSFMSI